MEVVVVTGRKEKAAATEDAAVAYWLEGETAQSRSYL